MGCHLTVSLCRVSNKLTFNGIIALSVLNEKQISLKMQHMKVIIQEKLILYCFQGTLGADV